MSRSTAGPEWPNTSLTPMRGDGNRAFLADHSADSLAQAADDVVLFHGDNAAGFLGSLDDDLPVNGLDGMDVDDPGVDAGGFQCLGGLDGLAHHEARGHNGDVLAVPER